MTLTRDCALQSLPSISSVYLQVPTILSGAIARLAVERIRFTGISESKQIGWSK